MKIPKEIKELFENEKYHQLATASVNGVPNVSTIGGKYVRDDETIVIVDNYMNKTLENVLSNPFVAILVRKEKIAYQIKGKCRYVNEGTDYEEARKWMKSKGDKYPAKGALIITVEEIFNSMTGPDAGKRI